MTNEEKEEARRKMREAGNEARQSNSSTINSLTHFSAAEITRVINETGISQADLGNVIAKVQDATLSNNKKAEAIKNIHKGVDALVGLAAKFI